MPVDTCARHLRPREVAKRLDIKVDAVLAWIRAGELHGTNVAVRVGGRPRWRITETDLQAFLLRRSAAPPAPARRRRRQPADVIQYF